MRIFPLIFMLACVACEAAARAQDDERPASRGLLKRGLLKSKTTTTTTAAPEEDAEYEEYAEGEEPQEASTEAPPSSTEGKKLVAGGVRPFRSNTDLLETLKRRRAQAAEAKLHAHSQAAVPASDAPVEPAAAAKSSYNKSRSGRVGPPAAQAQRSSDNLQNSSTKPGRWRQPNTVFKETVDNKKNFLEPPLESKPERPRSANRNGRPRSTVTYHKQSQPTTPYPRKTLRNEIIDKKRFNTVPKESQNEETAAPLKPSRTRFGRPSSRSVQEEPEEQNESAPAPIRTGRTFARKN